MEDLSQQKNPTSVDMTAWNIEKKAERNFS